MTLRLDIATRKGFFQLERRKGGWGITGHSFLGEPLSVVLSDPRDGTLYAALNLGHFGVKLHRSHDGGKSWQECAVPVYPPKPSDAADDPNPWTLQQIWCLEPGGVDQPGLLWAGTIPGGLFLSTDGGDSWQLVESLWNRPERTQWFGGGYDQPGIHSVCVDPRDSNRLAVAVSCGGVWHSDDRGESWTLAAEGMYAEYMPPEKREDPTIQDPHRMVRCRDYPDTLWVQHHNGIFRSDDGGRHWLNIEPGVASKFGFAVAVHPADPLTAWFAPAVKDECRIPVDGKLIVSRTRDGGKSFEVLSKGLPHPHSYDLIYRHALDVDETGSVLAFGSTTGGLWISEDAGDNWFSVSAHLPPIYCVRFTGQV